MKPKVTIVIPCYNRAHVVKNAIQSIQSQDYLNTEILLVDDGSSDNLGRVVEEIGEPRIRLIKQSNMGANSARNVGIDQAAGEYIAFLDSDDQFLPNHLNSAIALLQNNDELSVVFGRIIVDRGNGVEFIKPPRPPRPREHIANYLFRDDGFIQTSTVVLRTSLAQQVRYLPDLPFGQDTDFAVRLFNAGAKFIMKNEASAIFHDRADPNRISSRANAALRLRWAASMKSEIPYRAYLGFQGWYTAKAYR